MKNALFGRGLVASNLDVHLYDDQYHSENFREAIGREYGTIYVAGISGTKWMANKDPEGDWSRIRELLEVLRTMKCRNLVLFSTVDVFRSGISANEYSDPNLILFYPDTTYGRNRLLVEEFFWKNRVWTNRYQTIRLPGLFGRNLKKNLVHDLLNLHRLENVNLDSEFQWYDLSRLSNDVQHFMLSDRDVIHIAPEPIQTRRLIVEVFPELRGDPRVGANPDPTIHYGIQTLWGLNKYTTPSWTTIENLKSFKENYVRF